MSSRNRCLEIQDAVSLLSQRVSLLAVILEYSFPKTTRGTDYCCSIRIVDPSHHETGVAVNFFAPIAEKLPHVSAAGDVIHLCNVTVRSHSGEVNLVYNKAQSSFGLYHGKDGGDFVPYQVSPKYEHASEDKIFIDKLRKWLVNFQPNEGTLVLQPVIPSRNDFRLFSEIKEGDHMNFACKILHFCEAAKDEWFIYAWDGTDTPPNIIRSKLEDEMNCPLSLQLESLPLPRDLYCTFPTVGSLLRIAFDRCIEKSGLHHLLNNVKFKWIKLVSMRLEVHAGLWRAVFTNFTKIRYASAEDNLILMRKRLSNERISLKFERNSLGYVPVPSSVTVVPVKYDSVPYVTLMDALTHEEVTAKFKCVVRVVSALPCQPEMVRSSSGIYRMRLTLEDATTRIHAYVFGEDGVCTILAIHRFRVLFNYFYDTELKSLFLTSVLLYHF
ncbi:hypothetical protein PIB30_038704 [Stylosanthes scabra]|uniref:Telomeric single stranded DNA binding POT1/Cdc13 domain-containing protein n=1 Tax=Stylosanthes scabra TaxID=79078 RepID=A0ABU6REM7_9FABA|nr:hypothetical protein [Stylosanthes scabra]